MRDDERIPNEARGQRRLWSAAESKRFSKVLAAFGDREVRRAAKEFSRRSGRHVAAALVLRNALDPRACLEHMDLKAKPPILVWSAIDASPESPLRDSDEHTLTMEERQPAASVHYVGTAKDGLLLRGLWSSSYSAHAIGRLLQRWPRADPSALIRQGHRRLLAAPSRTIAELVGLSAFVLATDEGAWWATAEMMKSSQTGQKILHVRCRSWLSDPQITPEQIETAARLLTLREGDVPLGASFARCGLVRSSGNQPDLFSPKIGRPKNISSGA